MNQTDLALIGGVVKATQINYERNERQPDAEYLRKLHEAGIDACYILTGQRTPVTASDALLAFPQGLNALVQSELAKGTSPGLLVRDLLQITQKVALKLPD